MSVKEAVGFSLFARALLAAKYYVNTNRLLGVNLLPDENNKNELGALLAFGSEPLLVVRLRFAPCGHTSMRQ